MSPAILPVVTILPSVRNAVSYLLKIRAIDDEHLQHSMLLPYIHIYLVLFYCVLTTRKCDELSTEDGSSMKNFFFLLSVKFGHNSLTTLSNTLKCKENFTAISTLQYINMFTHFQ